MSLLETKDLSISLDNKPILQNISLTLHPKQRLAVLGPSGAGKTSLLRLLAGLETPTTGTIHLSNEVASSLGKIHLSPERRRIAMIFQGLALFPHLRALDQITFAAPPHLPRNDRQDLATQLLTQVGLGNRPTARMDELSGGERQRIAIARALAQQPKILLLDEPFASLDDLTRATMRRLLLTLLDSTDTALILVTHQREDAFDIATDALVLRQGQAVDQASFATLLQTPTHPATVTTLALGDLLPATHLSNLRASTPFGEVALTIPPPATNFQILLRPGQLTLDPTSPPNAELLSTHFTIPTATGPTTTARCRLLTTEQILHTQLPTTTIFVPHQKVCLHIQGPCHPLAS